MRCYLMRDGHITGVEDLEAATDADAIQLAIKVFYDRQATDRSYDGFELWDGSRVVHRHEVRQSA